MTSLLARLGDKIFPPLDAKVLLMGLDGAGKTALLYRVKIGEEVKTLPTIGCNVETLAILTKSGKVNFSCWDIGSSDRLRPMLPHYMGGAKAILWVVDSADESRLSTSPERLKEILDLAFKDQQTADPVAILANKQDLPESTSMEEIRQKFATAFGDRLNWAVFPVTATTSLEKGGLQAVFDWVAAALNSPQAGGEIKGVPPPLPIPSNPAILASRLESWLERTSTEPEPDELLKLFEEINLPSWDHYTHVRLAYIILIKYGRQKGKDMIFEGNRRYIEKSPQAAGRSFHLTMSYFWIHMVHFAIRSTPLLEKVEDTADAAKTASLTNDQFHRFLLLNPYLADGMLWADYYSKEVIMNPNAKIEMVLPDLKPLPDVVNRETINSVHQR